MEKERLRLEKERREKKIERDQEDIKRFDVAMILSMEILPVLQDSSAATTGCKAPSCPAHRLAQVG